MSYYQRLKRKFSRVKSKEELDALVERELKKIRVEYGTEVGGPAVALAFGYIYGIATGQVLDFSPLVDVTFTQIDKVGHFVKGLLTSYFGGYLIDEWYLNRFKKELEEDEAPDDLETLVETWPWKLKVEAVLTFLSAGTKELVYDWYLGRGTPSAEDVAADMAGHAYHRGIQKRMQNKIDVLYDAYEEKLAELKEKTHKAKSIRRKLRILKNH